METVTFVLDGNLLHNDHTGASGSLATGDVQLMTAGSGIMHSEMSGPGGVHNLQLCLNLPAARKGIEPGYNDVPLVSAARFSDEHATLRLYAGALRGRQRPFASHWPMTLIDVVLDPGGATTIEVPPHNRAFAYVLESDQLRLSIDSGLVKGDVAWLEVSGPEGGAIEVAATGNAGARILIYSAEPIDEPVAFGGPFVMNTEAEIDRAFEDFNSGRLIADVS